MMPFPLSLRWRRVLSIWVVFHLLMVVNYVWINEDQKKILRPISMPYIHWLQLTQKWHMFKSPAKWDRFLEPVGIRPDGSEISMDIAVDPPEGSFLHLRYNRWIKVHNIVAYEKEGKRRYGEPLARWLCTQFPEPVTEVRLNVRKERHRSPRQWRQEPLPPRKSETFEIARSPCDL